MIGRESMTNIMTIFYTLLCRFIPRVIFTKDLEEMQKNAVLHGNIVALSYIIENIEKNKGITVDNIKNSCKKSIDLIMLEINE